MLDNFFLPIQQACKLIVASILLIFSSISFAQGLKFENSAGQRFNESNDSKVGETLIDGLQNIVWMRCAVEQSYDSASKECIGKPVAVAFPQAVAFANKIGRGWRLPTWWELQSAEDHVRRVLGQGKSETVGRYGGGGWDCDGLSLWTQTGVENQPNKVNMASCKSYMQGTSLKNDPVSKFENYTAGILLVREVKGDVVSKAKPAPPSDKIEAQDRSESRSATPPQPKQRPRSDEELKGPADANDERPAHVAATPCAGVKSGKSLRIKTIDSPQSVPALVIEVSGSTATLRVMGGPSAGKKLKRSCSALN